MNAILDDGKKHTLVEPARNRKGVALSTEPRAVVFGS